MTATKTFHVSPALNKIKILDDINQTVTTIEGDVVNLQSTADDIYTDTQWLTNNVVTEVMFASNMTEVYSRFDNVDADLTILKDYCSDANTNSSELCLLVAGIDTKVDNLQLTFDTTMTDKLTEINATTHSTYDYVTGTLTTTVNNILGIVTSTQTTVNQINSTVNDIKTQTDTIETNTDTLIDETKVIRENQENATTLTIIS